MAISSSVYGCAARRRDEARSCDVGRCRRAARQAFRRRQIGQQRIAIVLATGMLWSI